MRGYVCRMDTGHREPLLGIKFCSEGFVLVVAADPTHAPHKLAADEYVPVRLEFESGPWGTQDCKVVDTSVFRFPKNQLVEHHFLLQPRPGEGFRFRWESAR